MESSAIRYGPGVTQEVGMDMVNMNARKVCVMTDPNLSKLAPVKTVMDSLAKNGVKFYLYDEVRVEPTEERYTHAPSLGFEIYLCSILLFFYSLLNAAQVARRENFDAFIAVGGGSVIDTCKAANLYASDPDAEFLDYVNPPIGKGKRVTVPLKPLIASKYCHVYTFCS